MEPIVEKFNHRMVRMVQRLCDFLPANLGVRMVSYFVATVDRRSRQLFDLFEPYAQRIDPDTTTADDIIRLNLTIMGQDIGMLVQQLSERQSDEIVARLRKISKLFRHAKV